MNSGSSDVFFRRDLFQHFFPPFELYSFSFEIAWSFFKLRSKLCTSTFCRETRRDRNVGVSCFSASVRLQGVSCTDEGVIEISMFWTGACVTCAISRYRRAFCTSICEKLTNVILSLSVIFNDDKIHSVFCRLYKRRHGRSSQAISEQLSRREHRWRSVNILWQKIIFLFFPSVLLFFDENVQRDWSI